MNGATETLQKMVAAGEAMPILDVVPVPILVHRRFRPLYANPAYATLLGFDDAAAVLALDSILDLIDPLARARARADCEAVMAGERTDHARRLKNRGPDGATRWLDLVERRVDWADGPAVIATYHDVTAEVEAQRRAEAALVVKDDLLAGTMQVMPAGIAMFDRDLNLVGCNEAYRQLWGLDAGATEGRPNLRDLTRIDYDRAPPPGRSFEAVWADIAARFEDGADLHDERLLGNGRTVDIRGARLPGGQGYVFVYTDITRRKAMERDLRQLAMTDSLTGLANRRHLLDAGAKLVAMARRLNHPVSVMMADLDRFKEINDRFGHEAGDAVLCRAARAFEESLREGDLVGRLGGEEFAVVLFNADTGAALAIAERVRRRFAALSAAAVACEGPGDATISIGVATLIEAGEELPAALGRADRALYAAKRAGRDRVRAADPDPDPAAPAQA